MTQKSLTQEDLRQFTGTEHWYRHPLVRKILYTDGAQYVAVQGGAHWLLDEIALSQGVYEIASEDFQVWTLSVKQDRSAVLSCEDGNLNVVYSLKLNWTDFPLDTIRFYFTDNTILLPSEY
jgi:hypothetical protein